MNQKEEIYCGIWIDLKKAVIIEWRGDSAKVRTLNSGIETRPRFPGEKDQSGQLGKQAVTDERNKEHRLEHEINHFLKQIADTLTYHAQIVIFGPAEMKKKLHKHLKGHPVLGKHIAGIAAADHMTDNQMSAWVKDYFKGS